MFLLDTDHISILQRQTGQEYINLHTRMCEYPANSFFLPIISFHEESIGWHGQLNRKHKDEDIIFAYRMFEKHLRTFANYSVLSFDAAAVEQYKKIDQFKKRTGTLDKRIAAIALSRDLTVLTRDRHFDDIPDLRVEDRTKPLEKPD